MSSEAGMPKNSSKPAAFGAGPQRLTVAGLFPVGPDPGATSRCPPCGTLAAAAATARVTRSFSMRNGEYPSSTPLFQFGPPGISARENPVARRSADGRGRMRVGEAHALSCQLVEIRRWNPRRRVVNAQVAVAQIVCQDEDNVEL